MQAPGVGHTSAAAPGLALCCCCDQRGDSSLHRVGSAPKTWLTLWRDGFLLTVEDAEGVWAAGKEPECGSDVSMARTYLCWEVRCALTWVGKCSASVGQALVILMWAETQGGPGCLCFPAVHWALPQCFSLCMEGLESQSSCVTHGSGC